MGKIDGLMLAKVSKNLLDEEYEMSSITEFTDIKRPRPISPIRCTRPIKKIVAGYTSGRVAFDAEK
jgi:hypothetical protein